VNEPIQSLSPSEGLGIVLDEYLRWIGQWHRAVFYRQGEGAGSVSAPASFAGWCAAARRDDLAQQPAIGRLAVLHEQMHRQARLSLLKAADGEPPSEDEYESVIGRFEDFMALLRRLERAFAAADSGLDPLTGLRSRRGMQESLDREFNRFRRLGEPFCVALGDIDHFKSVNDTYGHDMGDRVLAGMAAVISRAIRNFDEAFRMGGEEFLVCLKETTLEDAFPVIERLRVELMNAAITLPDGRTLSVTASFGLAQAAGDVGIDELIVRADKALYQAKHGGRNRVVCFDGDPPPARRPRGSRPR
jgi:diguanylate cyclase (GGDEF)-like protein